VVEATSEHTRFTGYLWAVVRRRGGESPAPPAVGEFLPLLLLLLLCSAS